MSTITYRLAKDADLGAASRVACATFLEDVAPLYCAEGVQVFLSFADECEWRKRQLAGDRSWLALEDEAVVGVVHVRDGHHLSMFFVLPSHQRRGIGRALIERVLRELPHSELTVHSSPNAVGVYQRFGFEVSGSEVERSGIRYVAMRRCANNPQSQVVPEF